MACNGLGILTATGGGTSAVDSNFTASTEQPNLSSGQYTFSSKSCNLYFLMKKLSFILLLVLSLALAHSDEKYVYDGVFNGTPKDDGNNNFEIALILFHNVKFHIKNLNLQTTDSKLQTNAALLLDSMLQIRAFCDQRSDKLALTPSQKEQTRIISETLSPLKLSYHQNERQELVDLCKRDAALVDKLRILAQIKAFQE
jgi:hypothetical protein